MELTAKEFEQLLYEFCRQDLPPNFIVEYDSKELGEESGNRRQIDTKIRGRLGISNILICGEAKNWNEPVGSEVIDGLVGKYMAGEVRANKVIVFSNNGYTAHAITRAKILGIELLEPNELGRPIVKIPHIVGIGYLNQLILMIIGSGPQYSEISAYPEEYIIIKGEEKISFQQNVCRLVVWELRQILNKNIYTDLSEIKVEDKNVLYELKEREGYRYNATFKVTAKIEWDYFVETLPIGVLRHLNSGEYQLVNIQGDHHDILNKVMLSPNKVNYETKEDCIKNVVDKNIGHLLHLCIADPDRNKSNPQIPLLIPV